MLSQRIKFQLVSAFRQKGFHVSVSDVGEDGIRSDDKVPVKQLMLRPHVSVTAVRDARGFTASIWVLSQPAVHSLRSPSTSCRGLTSSGQTERFPNLVDLFHVSI